MELFILLHLVFILFSATNAQDWLEWNTDETSRSVKPDIRRFKPKPNDDVINPHYHYKSHFGIIIQHNTTFTLKVKSSKKIEDLYFHCLTSSARGSYNEISLRNKKNYKTSVTSNADCVPMVSVSYNVPVEIEIRTKNWATLPIFDTGKVTFLTSKRAENEFYKNLKTYGFVENYYTQMLISFEDAKKLQLAKYSLYLGLQNQADLVQYYDYLIGSSRYINENERITYNLFERSSIFLRTEPCDPESERNSAIIESSSLQNGNSIYKNKTLQQLNPTIYDKCEDVKKSCKNRMSCNYYAYYSSHWVAIITDVSEFLNPKKGSDWVLLHEVGHNYNIAPYKADIVGLGNTMEVWNNIFAALYQSKFDLDEYWINSSISETEDTISNYRNGNFIGSWDWPGKLHFFISLFGYDGTDSTFREFHIRYYQRSETKYLYYNNIIPTILEVFLDLHNVNILPYLRKVVNFKEYVIPLVNEELELRLLSGQSVLPAIDFNVNASDVRIASTERDFRYSTPLILLPKLPKKYLFINFHITSPIFLFGRCMYLNNECHKILGHVMELRLLSGVYSSYISVKIGKTLYISEIEYHTIIENMIVNLKVKKIKENDIFLPLIHYSIDAYGISDMLFATTFINYKNNEIAVSQFTNEIHYSFPQQVYHSVTLKRDEKIIFDYKFLGESENDVPFVNYVHEFEIGDVLHVHHREMYRVNINGDLTGVNWSSSNNTFIFTPVGLHNIENNGYDIIEDDIKRINNFMNRYKIDLSYNLLFKHYLERYARNLVNFSNDIKFPKQWLSSEMFEN